MLDGWNGFTPDESTEGMGIVGMRDYAEMIGGECVIQCDPGKGTKVIETLPLVIIKKELPETTALSG